MNISHQNIDEINAVITVDLGPEDYNPQVDKAIKEQAKKAKLPGFRPGMVPTSHIRRTYGKAILFDEINRLVSDQINQYISENKLDILGQPLPKEDDKNDYQWDFNDTFSFNYEIGLAPQFDVPFNEKSKFPEYVIKADEETLESRIKNLRRSYGKMTNPEVSEDGDVLYSELKQLDADGNELEGGIVNTASVRTDLVDDKKIKKTLIGLKKDDELTLDVKKAFKNVSDVARILGVKEEEAESLENTTFKLTVKNVNRLEEADLTEDFYDKLFGEGTVKTEAEFKEKVREEVESNLAQNAAQKLQNDLYLKGLDAVKVDFPEAFLKRWLKATNPEIKEDELEEGFADFIKNLKWTLIENRIITQNGLEVKYEEVLALAKERIAAQIRMYSPGQEPTDQQLAQYAVQLLGDKEQANRLFDEVKALKVFDYLKGLVKLEKKEIEYNKFLELK
ncbi:trigger factor [Parapedobacter indicus]|uniref:Trigger factor n=1 Tax=Parapedobacter indicus TaxID=1477437 RepID=A0A1I3STF0_9SPHI|nr:trigger factor [Parapedobacter indicus]PPK99689.1 trigger factor [Parapedobacter indicus]SFJ62084.1 trigger factor [Parapedobacter indicus]